MTFSKIRNTLFAALCLVACGDAGGVADGGGARDAGVMADAGRPDSGSTTADAGGTPGVDAGARDAGFGRDGGTLPLDAGPGGSWDAGSGCNLVTQDCPSGTSCQAYRDPSSRENKTGCFMFGAQTSGACNTGADCAAGYVCLGSASYGCLKICAYPNGGNVCPTGTACQDLGFGGAGYCRSTP